MVLAYHLIMTAYGFWLPNDPRGSWSDFVWAWELRKFGAATKVNTTRSVAGVKHDYRARAEAKRALKYPPVVFDGVQGKAIGEGFGVAVEESGYLILGCSILPEHVHLVVGRHATKEIEDVAGHLKAKANIAMLDAEVHPFQEIVVKGKRPTPWTERFWAVFLDSGEDVLRAVRYVEGNPMKEGKRVQRWSFVRGGNGG